MKKTDIITGRDRTKLRQYISMLASYDSNLENKEGKKEKHDFVNVCE